MTNKTAKKNKKVFRQGVVQIHGRFVLEDEGTTPVLIKTNGASRGVHSVVRDGDAIRVFLNMPKATFLGTPIVSYLDDDDAAGSIYQFIVSDVVSTPGTYPGNLAYFDISAFNYDNELTSFPGTCLFTVNVTTAVVPNGMLPVVEDQNGPIPPTWDDATAYVFGEKVELDDKYYVALQASTDIEPGVADGWEEYWEEYSLFPYEFAARTAIGPTAIVHTPKVESVSVYGRFMGIPAAWSDAYTYAVGNYVYIGFKVYKAIAENLNVEPGVDVGWEASWEEAVLLISENAESEGVSSVVLNNDGQYPDLPTNVYIVTLDPVSPIVQFLGAPTITLISRDGPVGAYWRVAKVFCEGASATYGTSANQIVFAFYDTEPVPEINLLETSVAEVVHFTLQYTTSNVF